LATSDLRVREIDYQRAFDGFEILRDALIRDFETDSVDEFRTVLPLTETAAREQLAELGFRAGREVTLGGVRQLRLRLRRHELVQALAMITMAEHLDLRIWKFRMDSAKRRAGACNHTTSTISLSAYLAEYYSFDRMHQTMLHEVAHALAGHRVGHGAKWRELASSIGYRHERFEDDLIADAVAPIVGHCPAGHVFYRYRWPKRRLYCLKCSNRLSAANLITFVERS
jgi:predicted SprT family Zn-dependent metalloprotease